VAIPLKILPPTGVTNQTFHFLASFVAALQQCPTVVKLQFRLGIYLFAELKMILNKATQVTNLIGYINFFINIMKNHFFRKVMGQTS